MLPRPFDEESSCDIPDALSAPGARCIGGRGRELHAGRICRCRHIARRRHADPTRTGLRLGSAVPSERVTDTGAETYYVDRLRSGPDALRGSFGSYRAIDTSAAQNEQRKKKRLTLPVLAIGGAKGIGEGVVKTMKLVADNVQGVVISGSGHWVAEEAPQQFLAAVTPFFAPYREGSRATR